MNRKKVLVIEDEVFLQKSIYSKLLSQGYDVLVAKDGAEGLKLVKEKPDLIWLDLYMPGVDGVDFLKVVAEDPELSKIPIFIVSVSQGKTMEAGEVQGPNIIDFIVKSNFSLKNIIDRIGTILEK